MSAPAKAASIELTISNVPPLAAAFFFATSTTSGIRP